MAKSFFSETQEWSGPVPAGGYKCQIEEIERGVTGEQAMTPGCKRYSARLRVVEPKKHAGSVVIDWFTIGTEDDPKARDQATWNQSLGAKRLFRLLKRAGVAAKDGDDEEWMDAAQGQEVCCHIRREKDENGQFRNRINGDYFKESDEDFVGVGELLEASGDGRGGPRSARANGPAKAARGGAGRRPPTEDEDDAPVKARAKKPEPDDEDEGDEEGDKAKVSKASKPGVGNAKAAKGRLPKDDDEEDDDED